MYPCTFKNQIFELGDWEAKHGARLIILLLTPSATHAFWKKCIHNPQRSLLIPVGKEP